MKTKLIYLVLIIVSTLISCSKNVDNETLLDLRNPDFIIGVWMDKNSHVIQDNNGEKIILKDGVISFKEDSTYTVDNPEYWLPLNAGKWSCSKDGNSITFNENVPKINGIPISNWDDFDINTNWEIISFDNDKMKVMEHLFREGKIVTSPITQKKDTIQGIDIYISRNLSRVE